MTGRLHPNWLREVVQHAVAEVAKWPEWKKPENLKSEKSE